MKRRPSPETGKGTKNDMQENNKNNYERRNMMACEETVQIWIENFNEEGRDLQEEIDEVKGTLSNERLFQKGETTEEGILMRAQNIADLTAYLEFLEKVTYPVTKDREV